MCGSGVRTFTITTIQPRQRMTRPGRRRVRTECFVVEAGTTRLEFAAQRAAAPACPSTAMRSRASACCSKFPVDERRNRTKGATMRHKVLWTCGAVLHAKGGRVAHAPLHLGRPEPEDYGPLTRDWPPPAAYTESLAPACAAAAARVQGPWWTSRCPERNYRHGMLTHLPTMLSGASEEELLALLPHC